MTTEEDDLQTLIDKLSLKYDADIVVYFGDITRSVDTKLIRNAYERRKRKNVLLMLSTYGGDPHAAYRIARCLQGAWQTTKLQDGSKTVRDKGGDFLLYVDSACKSAGTIISLAADKLFMTENAELGPIDVQLPKQDEVGERTSGLTPLQAVQFLENQSLQLYKRHFGALRSNDIGFSTKLSAEVATNLTVGLLKPIYEQIDPVRLAEVDRSLRIASDYGERLIGSNGNVRDGKEGLVRLLTKYSSHGFVIDHMEAREIFKNVEESCSDMAVVARRFRTVANWALVRDEPFVHIVSTEMPAPSPPPPPSGDPEPGKGNDNAA